MTTLSTSVRVGARGLRCKVRRWTKDSQTYNPPTHQGRSDSSRADDVSLNSNNSKFYFCTKYLTVENQYSTVVNLKTTTILSVRFGSEATKSDKSSFDTHLVPTLDPSPSVVPESPAQLKIGQRIRQRRVFRGRAECHPTEEVGT